MQQAAQQSTAACPPYHGVMPLHANLERTRMATDEHVLALVDSSSTTFALTRLERGIIA